jgi:hypothetical protein
MGLLEKGKMHNGWMDGWMEDMFSFSQQIKFLLHLKEQATKLEKKYKISIKWFYFLVFIRGNLGIIDTNSI